MKVLVADGHALYRMGMRGLLSELEPDIEVTDAEDYESVERAFDSETKFDLAIVDLDTPSFDRSRGISKLGDRLGDTRLVVISASDDVAEVQGVIDQGAAGFLLKSTQPEVMLNALRLVLSGGIYLPPSVLRGSPALGLREARQRRYETESGDGPPLTPRQQDVMRLLALGKSNKDIARELDLAEGTVKVHISAIFKALNVTNRTEAVIKSAAMQQPTSSG